ncbi:low temperature requirement protein A [Solwaraspora sp. WMMB335]|uniref:low temperature requirement protein A n=1 Tax=Solwaraspora sp. WMMB335 TaxID=3404118 RepID=UPI003B941443
MTAGGGHGLLRSAGAPSRATFLELFFDLVFVVALALLSETLVSRLNPAGVAEAAIGLLALWWVWVVTTLVTDLYNPQSRGIQMITVGIMFGVLLMASSLPTAFTDRAGLFAGAYVAIHLARGLFFFLFFFLTLHEFFPLTSQERSTRTRHQRMARERAVRIWAWFAISAVPWIGGVLAGEELRLLLWTVALVTDYTVFALGYPLPGRARIAADQFSPTAEHLAERYHQFFIIALGDIILIAGMTFSRDTITIARTAGFVVAFASAAILFRLYVHCAGDLLTRAIEAARTPGRFSKSAPYTHLLMVAGVMGTATSAKLVIEQPSSAVPGVWALVIIGAPVIFLLGRTRFEYEVFGRIGWPLLAGAATLAGVLLPIATVAVLPPLPVAACVNLVLLAIIGFDLALRGRRNPVPPAPPL